MGGVSLLLPPKSRGIAEAPAAIRCGGSGRVVIHTPFTGSIVGMLSITERKPLYSFDLRAAEVGRKYHRFEHRKVSM